ncbi:MAG: hypothetical protein K0S60_704 [Evtepia sp.]|jgi:hypothetical protein|nr:hypothetical protein [Evtepia sp.]
MKETFLMCGEWERHLALLSDEQAGQLLKAIFAYQNRREAPTCEALVQLAFSFMQAFFDESHARYEEKVRANRENGKLGGRPRKPVGLFENPEELKKTLPESESVSDSVSPNGDGEGRVARPHFTPPTLPEVSDYVLQRSSAVVPQEFIDFYAAKGWMVGKSPMKDWRAACRNAEKWDRWQKAKGGFPASSREGGQNPERFKADMGRLDELLKRTEERKESLC